MIFSERLQSKHFTHRADGDEAKLRCMGHQTKSWKMKGIKGVGKFVLKILRD